VTTYWKIRARLLRVPGVANVAIWGERLKDLDVNVRPHRLRAERVALDGVMEVTSQALDAGLLQFSEGAVIGTGGFIEAPNQRISCRSVTPIKSPSDLAPAGRARSARAAAAHDPPRVARGPRRDLLRDPHQRRRRAARGLRGRPDRIVLPAARAVVWAGGAGLNAGGADASRPR
jgi:hypothetical protein